MDSKEKHPIPININRQLKSLVFSTCRFIKFIQILIIIFTFTSSIQSQDYTKTIELQKRMQTIMAEMMQNQNNPAKMEQLQKEFEEIAKQMQEESQNVMKDINAYKSSLHPVIQELHDMSNKVFIELDPVTEADQINRISKNIIDKVMKIYSGETEVTFPPDGYVINVRFCRETTATVIDKGTGTDKVTNLCNFSYKMTIPYKASWSTSFALDLVNKKGFFYGFELYSEETTESAKKVKVSDLNGYKQVIKTNGDMFNGPVDRYKVELGGTIIIGPQKLKQFNLYDISQWPDNLVHDYTMTYVMPLVMFYSSAGDAAEELQRFPGPCYNTINDQVFLTEKDLTIALEKGVYKKTLVLATSDPGCIDNEVTIEIPFPMIGCDGKQSALKGAIALSGDCIDHGGFILASEDNFFVNKKPVARVGDKVFCMIHGITEIVDNDPNNVTSGQKRIARTGDKTKCGATIISGSQDTYAGNK